ncbi:MAG: hypothetical protein BWY86_01003 [Candidatus Aminicenantes bacterium ADurb.Bin508]|nr:MAG: hypothetical protein BWY86_01003 [Candidatus Aminicenantes bacterium ADurb.Bin508]
MALLKLPGVEKILLPRPRKREVISLVVVFPQLPVSATILA